MDENSYYQYKSIKYTLNRIMTYHNEIHRYLIYLETCILRLVNGMNNFNRFFSYSLHVYFQYDTYTDESNNCNMHLISESFNTLKQNYLYKYTKNLNGC